MCLKLAGGAGQRKAMGQVRYAEELPRNAAELPHYAMGRRELPQNCRTMS